MKLRLTQPHYETFTGQMGTVFFVDGLSVDNVKPIDAVRMAAQFLCAWEDGSTASVAQSILDHAHETTNTIPTEQNADQALAKESKEAALLSGREPAREVEVKAFTADQLAEIADKEGIKGLRAIAEPRGIKGNSIEVLIKTLTSVDPTE